MLHGHSSRVNCIRWILADPKSPGRASLLVSGAVDGKVLVWKCSSLDQVGTKLVDYFHS